jgi:hypothetical protein
VVFICGEIKDLVCDSDKHCTYLEDPDDIDLNAEFDGINEDEVEDLKRKYVLRLFVLLRHASDCCQVGNAAVQLSGNSLASSLTFRRKLTKGHLKSSASFMQRWVNFSLTLVY